VTNTASLARVVCSGLDHHGDKRDTLGKDTQLFILTCCIASRRIMLRLDPLLNPESKGPGEVAALPTGPATLLFLEMQRLVRKGNNGLPWQR